MDKQIGNKSDRSTMSSSIADGKIYTEFPPLLRSKKKPLHEIQNLERDGVVSSSSSPSIACRVKYLVDTPTIIKGYLDKSMFLESAIRFMTASFVHSSLDNNYNSKNLPEWNIVESFQVEISKRSRETFLSFHLSIDAYANALAAVMLIDRLPVLDLFLDSRRSCILQKKATCLVDNLDHVITVFCDIATIVQLTLAQVGELFLQLSPPHRSRTPLLKKTLLTSLNSPASHLFSGIPNPDFEIVSWNSFALTMIGLFDQTKRRFFLEWFDDCINHTFSIVNGNYLIDAFKNAQQISLAEKKIRAALLQDNQVLEASLDWLNSVSASKDISMWKTTSELVLGDHFDMWREFFEFPFIGRMISITESRFDELRNLLNVKEWVNDIAETTDDGTDYPGHEANRISSLVHTYFEDVLDELLIFFESPNASLRQDDEDLAPCFRSHCFGIIYSILLGLGVEMDETMEITNNKGEFVMPRDVAVLRLLSIQRLLFAFQKHSERITMILGSPKLWVTKAMAHIPSNSSVHSPPKSGRARHVGASLIEQTSVLDLAGVGDSLSSEVEFLNWRPKELFSEARDLWMFWVVEKLSTDLSHNLKRDDNLSVTAPRRVGWEETIFKQEQSAASTSETKMSLPSMPSKYITSFLNQACVEIRRAGGHVLDKLTLQSFASTLLEKVLGIYGDFLSNDEAFDTRVSKEGVLQILLDLGFSADILSGGDFIGREDVSASSKVETSNEKIQDKSQTKKAISRESERIDGLINGLAQRLDRMDWLTCEPYLWEKEKQWYIHHAADFEFFERLPEVVGNKDL